MTWAGVAIGAYALVALVLFPEGGSSPLRRAGWALLIAMVAAAAVAIGRRAPGRLRGVGMLVLGFASVAVAAGIAVERVLRRPSPGAILGVAAGIGGATLVVVGWRRLLAGVTRPWVRVAVAVIGTLLVVQLVLLPATMALVATNRARPMASGRTPASVGLAYRNVVVASSDGVGLSAWWIPGRNGAAVIVLPGSGSTKDDALDHAALLADAGFGVLVVDPRGHGGSGGRLMEFGWGAERDVRAAVSFALGRPEVTGRVGLLGLSMGGEVALTSAATDRRVGAVVAEGATARTWDDARRQPDPHPVAQANEWVMFGLADVLSPESPPMALMDAVRRIEVPVLLIAGADGMERDLGAAYAAAAPGVVTLWSLPEAPHIGALRTSPEAYRERVLATFGVLTW